VENSEGGVGIVGDADDAADHLKNGNIITIYGNTINYVLSSEAHSFS
jgi:hypothetical protein